MTSSALQATVHVLLAHARITGSGPRQTLSACRNQSWNNVSMHHVCGRQPPSRALLDQVSNAPVQCLYPMAGVRAQGPIPVQLRGAGCAGARE